MAMLILTKNFGVHVGGREREREGGGDIMIFLSLRQQIRKHSFSPTGYL